MLCQLVRDAQTRKLLPEFDDKEIESLVTVAADECVALLLLLLVSGCAVRLMPVLTCVAACCPVCSESDDEW